MFEGYAECPAKLSSILQKYYSRNSLIENSVYYMGCISVLIENILVLKQSINLYLISSVSLGLGLSSFSLYIFHKESPFHLSKPFISIDNYPHYQKPELFSTMDFSLSISWLFRFSKSQVMICKQLEKTQKCLLFSPCQDTIEGLKWLKYDSFFKVVSRP